MRNDLPSIIQNKEKLKFLDIKIEKKKNNYIEEIGIK